MNSTSVAFLQSVLGADGAGALMKAVERSAVLEFALVPRTILAWLQSAPAHEGPLPGIDGSFATFEKSDIGFTGRVNIGEFQHAFAGASLFHVAASVAVALGVEQEDAPEGLRDLDLERLGKSIDGLAKIRYVNSELEKKSPPGKFNDLPEKLKDKGYSADSAFAIAWAQHNKEHKAEKSPNCSHCADLGKEELAQAEGTGAPAAPTAPKAPAAPATAGSKPKPALAAKPKQASAPTMTLTRSEAARLCSACGIGQFKGDEFNGCICFRAMNKAVKVISADAEAITIEMDPKVWGQDEFLILVESLRMGS